MCAWAAARPARTSHLPPQALSAAPPISRLPTSTSPPATQRTASQVRRLITAPSPAAPAVPARKAIATPGGAASARGIASDYSGVAAPPRHIVMLSVRSSVGPRAGEAGVRRRVRVRVFGYFKVVGRGGCAHFMKIGFSFFPSSLPLFFFSLFFGGLGWDSFGCFLFFLYMGLGSCLALESTCSCCVTDGRTDRQTDGGISCYAMLCHAIYLLSIYLCPSTYHLSIYLSISPSSHLSIDAPFPTSVSLGSGTYCCLPACLLVHHSHQPLLSLLSLLLCMSFGLPLTYFLTHSFIHPSIARGCVFIFLSFFLFF